MSSNDASIIAIADKLRQQVTANAAQWQLQAKNVQPRLDG